MKYYYLLIIFIIFSLCACTKDGFIKTGKSNGDFDGNMMEYFRAHPYDWDSTVLLIEKAGLQALFEGKEEKEIMFFGPTNHSIRKYMLANGITTISEMDSDFCRTQLLRYVVIGKAMREDIPRGKPNKDGITGEGGIIYTTIGGNKIWAYTFADSYAGVEGMGAIRLYITSLDKERKIDIASTDIRPNNGIVHSIHYNHTFGDM